MYEFKNREYEYRKQYLQKNYKKWRYIIKLTSTNTRIKIIEKGSRKGRFLSRIFHFMNSAKRLVFMGSFFTSQFSYCSFPWMSHSRTVNNKINKRYKRCLQIVYNDKKLSFKEPLETKSAPTHIKNLQVLAT